MKSKKSKETESKKVSIEFDERHLRTLVDALEVYGRFRSGQIAIALGTVFYDRECLNYEDKQVVESIVKTLAFRKDSSNVKSPNCYYGVGCDEMKEGTVAWEIKKIIEQYLHFTSNDGYRSIMDVSGDGAMQYSEIPLPSILDSSGYWKPKKQFIVPKKYQEQVDKEVKASDFEKAWKTIDKAFASKPLPKGKTSRIEKYDGSYYVVVEYPVKRKDDEKCNN